jgi:hypothetical protein
MARGGQVIRRGESRIRGRVLFCLAAALVARSAIADTPKEEAQEEQVASCANYLSEKPESRLRIAGMYLWLYLDENGGALTVEEAGSVIAMVDWTRESLDRWCTETENPEATPILQGARVVVGSLHGALQDVKPGSGDEE